MDIPQNNQEKTTTDFIVENYQRTQIESMYHTFEKKRELRLLILKFSTLILSFAVNLGIRHFFNDDCRQSYHK